MLNEDNENLIPILDQVTTEKHLSLAKQMLDGYLYLSVPFATQKHWAVVPIQSANHFADSDIKLLSDAFSAFGFKEGLAITVESIGADFPASYQIKLTPEGLEASDWNFQVINFLITNKNTDFAIVCTTEEYYLVAGPLAFVKRAIGKDIQLAREAFLQHAKNPFWLEPLTKLMLNVAERYQHFNG